MALSVAAAPVFLVLMRNNGQFSVYVDGNQECCQARKMRHLKRSFNSFRAWFTGQIKDQSLGTRANIPIVRVNLTFEGINCGIGSLQVMNVPVNSFHSQGYNLIECEPCTRLVLPWQHEREGRWWWDAMAECGLHKRNGHVNGAAYTNGSATVTDIFMPRLENQAEPWLAVLYALWCHLCQAVEESYINLAEKLMGNEGKNMQSKICSLIAFPQCYFFVDIPPDPSNIPLKRGMLNHQWFSLTRFDDNDHHLSVQN